MGLEIRRATAEDIPALCALLAEGDEWHAAALPGIFRRPETPAWRAQTLSRLLETEGALVLVAVVDGELAGCVRALLSRSPDAPVFVPRRFVWVDEVVVASPYRGRGVGRALMEAVHRWARDRGAETVELHVWAANQGALAFYAALGYREGGRRMWKRL